MTRARRETLLWAAQRASAAVLALAVIVHLATIIYAAHAGLSAAEILGRTRGNGAWAAFYVLFVLAVAVHVPIGLRAVFSEWFRWRGPSMNIGVMIIGVALAATGLRAVWAVFA